MEQTYWDQLEAVKAVVELLQRIPVPETEAECEILRGNLDEMVAAAREMLRLVRPLIEVWCGRDDDPLRKGRVLHTEFDWIVGAIGLPAPPDPDE